MKTPLVSFAWDEISKLLRTKDLLSLLVGVFRENPMVFIAIVRSFDNLRRVGELPFFGCPVRDLDRAYGSQDTCCVLECDIAFSEVKLGDDTCSFEFRVELCIEIV